MTDIEEAVRNTIEALGDITGAIEAYTDINEDVLATIRNYIREREAEMAAIAVAPTTPTFEAQMTTVNIYATTEHGRGFLPPLMRAYGHILYLAGRQAESPTRKPTDDEITNEFTEGLRHLDAINTQNLSTDSVNKLTQATEAWNTAQREFAAWSATDREANFIKLANFLVHIMVKLDRELLGLRDSDIGSFA